MLLNDLRGGWYTYLTGIPGYSVPRLFLDLFPVFRGVSDQRPSGPYYPNGTRLSFAVRRTGSLFSARPLAGRAVNCNYLRLLTPLEAAERPRR